MWEPDLTPNAPRLLLRKAFPWSFQGYMRQRRWNSVQRSLMLKLSLPEVVHDAKFKEKKKKGKANAELKQAPSQENQPSLKDRLIRTLVFICTDEGSACDEKKRK